MPKRPPPSGLDRATDINLITRLGTVATGAVCALLAIGALLRLQPNPPVTDMPSAATASFAIEAPAGGATPAQAAEVRRRLLEALAKEGLHDATSSRTVRVSVWIAVGTLEPGHANGGDAAAYLLSLSWRLSEGERVLGRIEQSRWQPAHLDPIDGFLAGGPAAAARGIKLLFEGR